MNFKVIFLVKEAREKKCAVQINAHSGYQGTQDGFYWE